MWISRIGELCLMMVLLCFLVCLLFSGCKIKEMQVPEAKPIFVQHYEKLVQAKQQARPDNKVVEPLVTLAASEMSLAGFVRVLAQQYGIQCVVDEKLDQRAVTVEFQNIPASVAVSSVARRLGVQAVKNGEVYYFGDLRAEDVAVMVRRVRRLDASGIESAVSSLTSPVGKCQCYPDGLTVVADRVEVLQRVAKMLDELESIETATWVLQVYLISLTESEARNLGLSVTPSLDVSATFAAASSNLINPQDALQGELNGGLNVLLNATRDRLSVKMMAEPLFLLVDGSESNFFRGSRVPVVNQQITPNGASLTTTQSYRFVNVGLKVGVGVREVGPSQSLLTLDVENSSVSSYASNGMPVVDTENYDGKAVITSGGVYLVGEMKRKDKREEKQSIIQFGSSQADQDRTLQIWARAYRIQNVGHLKVRSELSGGATASDDATASEAQKG